MISGTLLINGVPGDQISAHDRGLLYGDGVFRTLRVHASQPLDWLRHAEKLRHDCTAIGIPCPDSSVLRGELQQLIALHGDGIAKIIVTRGNAERGYAPVQNLMPNRIIGLTAYPTYPTDYARIGIQLGICNIRLGHQPALAGIKHLNRLENVLAARELMDSQYAEGLLLDIEDNVIEGNRSNIFIVKKGVLFTPDLSRCGVAGVQRDRVLASVAVHGLACKPSNMRLSELQDADEIFLVNSVIGLWKVRKLQNRTWQSHPIASQIQEWLQHESDY